MDNATKENIYTAYSRLRKERALRNGWCGDEKAFPFGLVHCARDLGNTGLCCTKNGYYYWEAKHGSTNAGRVPYPTPGQQAE